MLPLFIFQKWEEERKNFNSEEIVLGDNILETPQNFNVELDAALGAANRENGSGLIKENKVSNYRDGILFFLVLLYRGCVAILRLVVPIPCDITLIIFRSLLRNGGKNYVKKKKIMGITPNGYSHTHFNIRSSAIRTFGLSYVRHKCKKVFLVRKIGKYRLSACLKSKDNNLKLSSKLDNGKSSESNLTEQEQIKRSTQNYMTLSEDNISSSRSCKSEDNNGNLKDNDVKSPATANDRFKSTGESFSTSKDGCNGLNVDFVTQSSSRKSYTGNYDKFRYINTSKAGEIIEKSSMENIKVQNSECNVGYILSQGRMNIGDLQESCSPSVGCTGDAMFEGGNNEKLGSTEGSEKSSINIKISVSDDQKLGKI